MKIREFFYIVISSLVFRGFLEILVGTYSDADPYYTSLLCQSGMYLLILLLFAQVMRKEGESITEIIGVSALSRWPLMLLFWPIVLLMFSLGENAVEIVIFSLFDKKFAYAHFDMHEQPLTTYAFISWRVACFVLVTSVISPIVEEFVFRGVLLRLMMVRFGVLPGVFVSSAIFTMFHFSHPEYISTFIFSIFVSIVYLRYGSLLLSMMVHAAYNLIAFIMQYYFDFQWTRSINNISNLSDWTSQLIMLSISLPILTYFIACHGGAIVNSWRLGSKPRSTRI